MGTSTEMFSTESVEMASLGAIMNESVANNYPEGCIVFGPNASVPWANPDNVITWETEFLSDRIKSAFCIPILYLIGVPANVLNMMVFFKQGLKERINFCLFSLALADLFSLTAIFLFYFERFVTQFTHGGRYGTIYRAMLNENMFGLYGFNYGPMVLSAIIATERCICVLFPLRAQRCIPTKVLAAIIIVTVVVLAMLRFVVTAQYSLGCFYEVGRDRMTWQVYVTEYYFRNRDMLQILDGVFYGFCLSVGCPLVVLVATIITAAKLMQTVRWRNKTISGDLNNKEIGVTKMLIALSIEFFILSTPIITLRISPIFEPELSAAGKYGNLFRLLLGMVELSSFTSSSINFFVYYSTGSRYRETLRSILCKAKQAKKTDQSKSTLQSKSFPQQSD